MLQAVLFDKAYNSPASSKRWLAANQLAAIKPLHTTANYHRARIREPHGTMRTIVLDKGRHIKGVVMYGARPRRGGSIPYINPHVRRQIARRRGGSVFSNTSPIESGLVALLTGLAIGGIVHAARKK